MCRFESGYGKDGAAQGEMPSVIRDDRNKHFAGSFSFCLRGFWADATHWFPSGSPFRLWLSKNRRRNRLHLIRHGVEDQESFSFIDFPQLRIHHTWLQGLKGFLK